MYEFNRESYPAWQNSTKTIHSSASRLTDRGCLQQRAGQNTTGASPYTKNGNKIKKKYFQGSLL